jgi:outer membrane cobalamin receptor
VSGFRFDLFGGFKKTDDAHFLVHNGQDVIGGDVGGYFKEALKPVYGSLSHTHIGGLIQTGIWAPLDLSLRLQKNFYDVSEMTIHEVQVEDARAYNKPGLEVDLRGTFDVMNNLKFTINYYFAGERWTYFNRQNLEMESINDLNLGATYRINEAFSFNLRANNLMMQKYDLWYGHPAQGFNVSGGFTFQF